MIDDLSIDWTIWILVHWIIIGTLDQVIGSLPIGAAAPTAFGCSAAGPMIQFRRNCSNDPMMMRCPNDPMQQ